MKNNDKKIEKRVKLGLTSRHSETMPELEGFIFPSVVEDVTNVSAIYEEALDGISKYVSIGNVKGNWLNSYVDGGQTINRGNVGIDLYVTGLTILTAAVIKVSAEFGVDLTLWHFDREKGDYYPQVIFKGPY